MNGRRLHFVGIGGAGMSGLALVAQTLGAEVSGSDRAESSYTERLRALGIEPAIGHDAANLPEGAEVVVSTAIAEDNPELVRAREEGRKVLHRADLLAELTHLKRTIAISGTHGKTTTSAMAAHVLLRCGREPAYLVGGELRAARTNAAWGAGEWLMVEADESDRSFLKLGREVTVVTNMELDHHATYRSPRELREAFEEFAAPAQTRIAWAGAGLEADVTYGVGEGELRAEGVELLPLGSSFTVEGVPVRLRAPGEHNVLNALAALAALPRGGGAAGGGRADAGGLRGRRPALRGARRHGLGRAHLRRLRAPSHRGQGDAGGCPHARAPPAGGLLPAAPLLAHAGAGARVRAGAGAGRRGGGAGRLPRSRAGRGLPRRVGSDRRAHDRRRGRRPAGVVAAPMDDAEQVLRERLGEGDVLLTLGAGDVDRLADRLEARPDRFAEVGERPGIEPAGSRCGMR